MANYHPFFVKESFSCLAKLFSYYTALLAIAHCIEAVWLWLLMLQHTHYGKTLILSKIKSLVTKLLSIHFFCQIGFKNEKLNSLPSIVHKT